jgi:hypothetical protein
MAQDVAISLPQIPVWRRPWPTILTGLALTALGTALGSWFEGQIALVRLLLIFSGVILAGLAVERRLMTASDDFEQRLESAGLVAFAAGICLIAFLGMDESRDPANSSEPGRNWDSGKMVFGVAALVALSGSVVVVCTGVVRRGLLCLFALYHLGGIATAITMIEPPGTTRPAPFLPTQAWVRLYRPYLMFLFQNNAYHFYSPEPGPPTHLWFYIRYANGNIEKFEMPKREDSPVLLHYQRLLSVGEFMSQVAPGNIPDHLLMEMYGGGKEGLKKINAMKNRGENPHDLALARLYEARETAPRLVMPNGMPYHPGIPKQNQYQPPHEYSWKMIQSGVRRIAHEFAHDPKDPSSPIVSIKMYRIRKWIISPGEFARGGDPLDDTYSIAWYQGEFRPDGTLVNKSDPFLFWLIPIVRNQSTGLIDNYVEDHARTDYNQFDREHPTENKP